MKKMFETSLGSEYYMGQDGYWFRRKYTGETFENWVYLGSIDSSQNPAFNDRGKHYPHLINSQFSSGEIPGFVPSFVEGNVPIGASGIRPGDVRSIDGKLAATPQADPKVTVSLHLGDVITRIYEPQLTENEKWFNSSL